PTAAAVPGSARPRPAPAARSNASTPRPWQPRPQSLTRRTPPRPARQPPA
ncbi:translation initiation factor IF-3, partial [Janibacter hoylei PVAS-1]